MKQVHRIFLFLTLCVGVGLFLFHQYQVKDQEEKQLGQNPLQLGRVLDSSQTKWETSKAIIESTVDKHNRIRKVVIDYKAMNIQDITQAMVYIQPYLYPDSVLVKTDGKREGCGIGYCSIDYELVYQSKQRQAEEANEWSKEELTSEPKGLSYVTVQLEYSPSGKDKPHFVYARMY